jgi:RNA polymerase sigma factor (sigma-70 family)
LHERHVGALSGTPTGLREGVWPATVQRGVAGAGAQSRAEQLLREDGGEWRLLRINEVLGGCKGPVVPRRICAARRTGEGGKMPSEFSDLIARVRSGDACAAEELFRKYEPVIRMEVRRQMRDPRLRRAFDSMDVCQSVLGSFFVRAALGQYDLEDPAAVIGLLVGMARHKVAEQVRKERRQCRDHRRALPLSAQQEETPDPGPSPSEVVAGEELLRAVQGELTEEERQLAERRAHGQSWAEVVAELGGTVAARRKQMERAIARVVDRFGLEGEGPG